MTTWLYVLVGLAALLVSVISIVGSGIVAGKWIIRRNREDTRHIVSEMTAELRPNGGGSMKDVVNLQSKRFEALALDVEITKGRVDFILEVLGIDGRAARARTNLINSNKENTTP